MFDWINARVHCIDEGYIEGIEASKRQLEGFLGAVLAYEPISQAARTTSKNLDDRLCALIAVCNKHIARERVLHETEIQAD